MSFFLWSYDSLGNSLGEPLDQLGFNVLCKTLVALCNQCIRSLLCQLERIQPECLPVKSTMVFLPWSTQTPGSV